MCRVRGIANARSNGWGDHAREGESHPREALVLTLPLSRGQAHLHSPLPSGAEHLADHVHERPGAQQRDRQPGRLTAGEGDEGESPGDPEP